MHFLRLYLLSACCVASFNVLAYGLSETFDYKPVPSLISRESYMTKETDMKPVVASKKSLKSDQNLHQLNKKMLNKLGLTKVRAPNSHNRKRLAVESRRHASPDDSHMFIIKLPPNLYYYTNPKADSNSAIAPAVAAVGVAKNSVLDHNNGKKVSFNFNSNGKPSRIYHWNLPVLKRMLSDDSRFSMTRQPKDELLDIKNIPTWTKPWENEAIEKSYGKSASMDKKSLKRKSPSYYVPSNVVNKNSFNKYFPGNGKPKGFYIIKGNHKKSTYYKNITP